MSKKLIAALVTVLVVTMLTMGSVFAAVPTPVLKVDNTTLKAGQTYSMYEGKTFTLSANGASKVAYKIGGDTTQIINGSSTTFKIPTNYTGTQELSIYVCAVASDGTQGDWYAYQVNIVKEQTVVPTPVLKVDNTTLKVGQTYSMYEGKTFTLSANGASKVAYKIGSESTQIINGSSTTFKIPTNYTGTNGLSIYVCAVAKDGTQGEWYAYDVNMVKEQTVVPTPVLKVDNTTLKAGQTYSMYEGKTFTLSANGASKVAYKIGVESTQIINGSSTTFKIPANYVGTNGLSIYVCAVASDGTQGEWYTYDVNIVKEQTVVPTPVLKVDDTTLKVGQTYSMYEGKTFTLSANGASKVAYKIGVETTQIINGSSTTFNVPTNYIGTDELSIYVCAVASDGTQGDWYTYKVNVVKNEVTEPTITVKAGNAVIDEDAIYMIDEGQTISINTTDATKIYYKIENEATVVINGTSTNFSIPSKYTDEGKIVLYVSVADLNGKQTEWKEYGLTVRSDDNTVDSTIRVKVNNQTVDTDATYQVYVDDEVQIYVPNAKRIYYKFGGDYTESIASTEAVTYIPDINSNGEDITLSISAILKDGTQTAWKVYSFEVHNPDYVTPNVTVKIGKTTLNNTTTYKIEEGQEIDIYAKNAKKIVYQIGNSSKVTVSNLEETITIPEKYTGTGLVTLKVATILSDGTQTSWKAYYFEVSEGFENAKYPFIILSDEKFNSDVEGLNVALRTVPVSTKTGNMNYFLLNEYIQYNIDFVNADKKITDKVYIEFNIPEGFDVKFVDIKGGKKVDENTIRWTFDGMQKGEKGTIPVTLYYTDFPSKNNVVKPYATIESDDYEDSSAVINLLAKNSSTVVETNHEKFMYGDADTNTFRPTEGMNRAEVAALLVRVLDLTPVRTYTVTYKDINSFEDPQYAWATRDIMTVTEAGLMEGYDDGTFRPGTKVTKAQLITILARAFSIEDEAKNSAFEIKDEPIKLFNNLSVVYSSYGYSEHWATKYLAQMIRLNILPEFANTIDGNLDLVITRAEAAKLFCTVLYRGPAIDVTKGDVLTNEFIDVTERTSYYEYILEATAEDHDSMYQKNGWEKITND